MKYSAISRYLLITLFVICGHSSSGQPKYEREYVLRPDEVPSQAAAFIGEVFKNKKVQWYKEEKLRGTSIEAKLKSSRKNYSVEFSDSGVIQDVEILVKFASLPAEAKSAITQRLKKVFDNFKISKVQKQWTGTEQDLKDALVNASSTDKQISKAIRINYELIVSAKKTGSSGYYEVLTDQSGQVKTIRQIIERNTHNLIY